MQHKIIKVVLFIVFAILVLSSSYLGIVWLGGYGWVVAACVGAALLVLDLWLVKELPFFVLWPIKQICALGLVVMTVFVGVANVGGIIKVSSNPELQAINENVKIQKTLISDLKLDAKSYKEREQLTNEITTRRKYQKEQKRLVKMNEDRRKLLAKLGTFQTGATVIYRWVAVQIYGKKPSTEQIETIALFALVIAWVTILCTQITLGAKIHSDGFMSYSATDSGYKNSDSSSSENTTQNDDPLLLAENSSDSSGSSSRSGLKKGGKSKGAHVKNRMKTRTFITQYYANNGKYPSYSVVQRKCKVGPNVVSEVMREIKNKAA